MHCHIALVAFVRLFPALHFRMWLKISRDSQAVRLIPLQIQFCRTKEVSHTFWNAIAHTTKHQKDDFWAMDHDLSMSLMLLWKWPNAVAYVWVSQITVLSGKNVLPNIFLPSALSKCLQMEWVQRAQIWYDKGFNLKFYKLVDCGRWISVSKFLPIFVYI